MLFFDPTYLIIVPALIFALFAQSYLKSSYSKYSEVHNRRRYTAAEVARQILDDNNLSNVSIEHINGNLTDHYDPRSNVVRLSDSVYNSTSVAAIGVAAHEVGHAVQHAQGYFPITIRNAVVPIVNIGSNLAMPLFLFGLIFSFQPLLTIGIFLYSFAVFFQVITLPVEINASRRALRTLGDYNILESDELPGAKKVLTAAAMTYVAGMLTALLSLLRLILIKNRNSRN